MYQASSCPVQTKKSGDSKPLSQHTVLAGILSINIGRDTNGPYFPPAITQEALFTSTSALGQSERHGKDLPYSSCRI